MHFTFKILSDHVTCFTRNSIPVIVLARVQSSNYNNSYNRSVHQVLRAMSAGSQALLVVVNSDLIHLLLPYEFPKARVYRAARLAMDRAHLQNVIWGRPWSVCTRPSPDQPTFVYVQEDVDGRPEFYTCVLCHNFIFEFD